MSAPRAGPAGARASWLLAAALVIAGCPETEYNARLTLERYLDAVQSSDRVAMALFSAEYEDAARGLEGPPAAEAYERFAERAARRLEAYERARSGGRLELGPDGVGLVKGLGLGRGAFYQIRGLEREGERLRMRLEVNLGYDQIPFERFPPGTRVYLMGPPIGRLQALVRGEGRGEKLTVLSRVELECLLERAPARDHPTGWLVRSLTAVPGSERTTDIVWR